MKSTAYHKILFQLPAFLVFVCLIHPSHAQTDEKCDVKEKICVINTLISTAEKIDNTAWRDQVYREIAKTLAANNNFDQAYNMIEKIQTPDTQAMTIRGIGMAVADHHFPSEHNEKIFKALRNKAEKIDHPPSYAIALTYIAMSQAFAGDNEGSWKTAHDMENQALRNKAFGETAEIQAEFGDYVAVKKSIGFIDTESFRDKAYQTVSKILGDKEMYEEAYDSSLMIGNPYKKALAIQYILDVQDAKNKMQDAP